MDMKDYKHITHEFEPIFDEQSRILILGTLPSVKSREGQFYYHHPQNRFWKVLAQICKTQTPETIAEKKAMLLSNGIAIWDVVQSCDIIGSSDSSIKNVTPADLSVILKKAPVKTIFLNGGKAWELYQKYCKEMTELPAVKLPSTSPANAAWSLEKLVTVWKEELQKGGL
ncbi:MAG: DNA-deoxyinosine glycosylase [Firmicutes bacterium]|nr:DNA-deoxyinosine glycosylase [Bacillota bacterium]MBR4075222.1 DNA-deoxyinosine glycosylase [Bacillota bacterium]MBR7147731.1 DNA-deoxyinosine glycosylase [Bacillota bacterium]